MISSDLPEVIGMADRVLVMHEGKLTAELSRSEATEEVIMFAATGQTGRRSKNLKAQSMTEEVKSAPEGDGG